MTEQLCTPDLPDGYVWLTCISLWRPWADWIAAGWKIIETRTHNRLHKLVGQRIGIHAARKWDNTAVEDASLYMTRGQRIATHKFTAESDGHILCIAEVTATRLLTGEDSTAALIDCHNTQRYGLFLSNVVKLPLCPETLVTGRQGRFSVKLPASLLASPASREGGGA